MKKIIATALILCICLALGGCKSNKTTDYSDVKKAQQQLFKQSSGHMVMSSEVNSVSKSDKIVTDFTYKLTPDGVMEYCQSQQDVSNKMVFCEFGDGVTSEQWLIGHGWSVIDPIQYTAENPHKFLQLLGSELDKKVVSEVSKKEEQTNVRYDIILDSEELNKTVYKDSEIEVLAQDISFLIDANGNIITYNDNATILDKATNTNAEYTLEVKVSEHNTVSEVKKPELRVAAAVDEVQK